MAAIFQIRRGTTNETLTDGELYLHKGTGSIQFGSGSSNVITLLPLNVPVVGNINLIGNITASNAYFTGDVAISGNLFLGNNSSDNISALGVFTSNLSAGTTNTYDIGSTTSVWRNVYATSISGAIAATNGVVSGSGQLVSVFEEKASTTHTLVSGSSQIISILDSLNSFSSSILTETASLEGRASTLATYTASVEDRFSTLATLTGSNLIRLSNLEAKSASVDTQLTTIGSVTSSLESRMATLAQVTSSIHSYTSSLKTAISVDSANVTILGDLTVNGTTTQINSTQVNIGENILELNYGGSANTAGIYAKDATGGSTTSGSLLWDATNDYWKAGVKDLESKVLVAGGDNVLSSSAQLTQLNSFTASVQSSLVSIYQTTSSLNLFSASVTSSLDSIYQTTGSLNTWSASAKVELVNLELKSASVDTSISNINFNTASVNTSVFNLNNETASIEGRFTTLSSYTASINQTTASLNEYTASANAWSGTIDTRFNTLQQVTSSLQSATASLFVSSSLMTASIYNHEGRIAYIEVQSGISTPYNFDAQFLAIAQVTGSLNTYTGSANVRFANIEAATSSYETKGRGIVSGSSQVTPLLPTGVVSGSSQITYTSISSIPAGIVSGSSQLSGTTITDLTIVNLTTVNETASVIFSSGSNRFGDFGNDTHSFTGSVQITGSLTTIGDSTATSFNGVINATNGVISGSSQITYASISSIPSGIVSGSSQILGGSGIVSGSSQITYASISSIPSGIVSGAAQIPALLPLGVVSGSSQVLGGSGIVSGSSQITYANISFIPSGIVSGSSQVLGGSGVASGSYETTGRSIVSSSAQIVPLLPAGTVSGSSQVITSNAITLGTHTTGNYIQTITGTANQITVAGSGLESADVTLSIPQNIHTSATPTFAGLTINGAITATGDITAYYSDKRLKDISGNIDSALDKVNQISGVYYKQNELAETFGYTNYNQQVGVIAQEIQSVLPEAIALAPFDRDENGNSKSGENYLTVHYEKIIPLLIESIKELSAKVTELENK